MFFQLKIRTVRSGVKGISRKQTVSPVVAFSVFEIGLEQCQAFIAQDVRNYSALQFLIERWQFAPVNGGASAHYIFIGVDDSGDAAQQGGRKTHQAGFHRAEQGCFRFVSVRIFFSKLFERDDFGVIYFVCPVAAGGDAGACGDNLILVDDNAAYREFVR